MTIQRNIKLLAWFNFFLDFRLYAPVAILYFADVAGSFALGMSVFSVVMLAGAMFEVPTGMFSDRFGRVRTLVIGAGAGVLAVTCYALGGSWGYGWLVIGAVGEGFARALYSGNNAALLHDTLTDMGQPDAYQEFLGKTSAMFQVALATSAILGGLLASVSFLLVMWLSVVPQVLTLVLGLRMIEPVTVQRAEGSVLAQMRTAFRGIVRNRKLRTISAASILDHALGESAFQFEAAFINTLWPVWALGLARTLSNGGAAISFYLSGRLIRRFGEFKLLMTGDSYSKVATTAALAVPTVASPALMASTSLFFGVKMVSMGGLMQREFSSDQRATMGSLTAFVGSLVFAAYSIMLGGMADWLGIIPALLITEGLSLGVMVLYVRAFRARPDVQPALDGAAGPD
ncbi:MAG: MFS transporter [Chloroflexi bacterium]|nr:MFS transporter [Chloroflexota bacterium]